jgi:uncharacterized lipoprotein YddW (UPF0748 family)
MRTALAAALLAVVAVVAIPAGTAGNSQFPIPNPQFLRLNPQSDRSDRSDQSAIFTPLTGGGNPKSAIRNPQSAIPTPPAPEREFRAMWIATVDNIDWPSRPGLTTEQQKAELTALLDRAAGLKLNAVVFQVRPACDAFYASKQETWSEFLTGVMGRAPEPFYDPLEFAVEEAHRRGIELHAWFNPFRARHYKGKSAIAADHVSRTRPELVRRYGRYLWLDPGDPAVHDYSLAVIRDVVRRYDIDGVHVDDYFYPYKERDAAGAILPFPDEPSWRAYVSSGGKLGRDDWRRENVNRFVRSLYQEVKKEKRWVKVGISPFGIWRPGHPPGIRGLDPYVTLYADSRKWLANGWADYFAPQLYWRINQPGQIYAALLKWWAAQNPQKRHLWPGNNTNMAGGGGAHVRELEAQIRLTRATPGASGNIHYSAKVLNQNRGGVADALAKGVYARPALVPASPWLDAAPPAKPVLEAAPDPATGGRRLSWKPGDAEKPWLWVLQVRRGGSWATEILPAHRTSLVVNGPGASTPADFAAVSAVDRCGNRGATATLRL